MHIYTHTRTNTHINILTGTNTQACLLKYAYARAQCTSKHAEINTNTKHNAYLQKQQQFKRVNRSMRCGRCHTCLNPKLKKACLTLRASQEKASGDGEDGLEHKVPCCGFRIDCAPCCASLSLSLSFSLALAALFLFFLKYLAPSPLSIMCMHRLHDTTDINTQLCACAGRVPFKDAGFLLSAGLELILGEVARLASHLHVAQGRNSPHLRVLHAVMSAYECQVRWVHL